MNRSARAEAVVRSALVPVRAEASHRSERVSEWLLGETLHVVDIEGVWLRASGPDGYEGWVSRGSLIEWDEAASERWRGYASVWSLGADLQLPTGAVVRAPFGARLRPLADGGLALPDGRIVRARDAERLVVEGERAARYPATADAVLTTARTWLETPYAWGGRTSFGVDCSGFTQAVFGLHGIRLPRDSGPQSAASPAVAEPVGHPDALPLAALEPLLEPADLLFFAPEGVGITHVAVVERGSTILHASASNGRVAIEDLASGDPTAQRLRAAIVAVTRPLADGDAERLRNPSLNPR